MQALIFTDLDGTLMEHETYSIDPAREMLAELARRQLQPILNSSKTRAEIEAIQRHLDLDAAFICENGAGLFNYRQSQNQVTEKCFGTPLQDWLESVHKIRAQEAYQFQGFSDWSAEEVSTCTGLDEPSAELAKQREFSEPVLWHDSAEALQQFRVALERLDLQILEGGRFLSIQGHYDKATAMNWLQQQDENRGKVIVALGDSPNDEAMLNAANIAVVVKSAKSDRLQLDQPEHIIHTSNPGPAGWQAAMEEVLRMLEAKENNLQTENSDG